MIQTQKRSNCWPLIILIFVWGEPWGVKYSRQMKYHIHVRIEIRLLIFDLLLTHHYCPSKMKVANFRAGTSAVKGARGGVSLFPPLSSNGLIPFKLHQVVLVKINHSSIEFATGLH